MSRNSKEPTPQQRADAVKQVVEGRRTELRQAIQSGDTTRIREASESLTVAEDRRDEVNDGVLPPKG